MKLHFKECSDGKNNVIVKHTHTLTVVRLTVCACGESDSEQSNDDSTRCGFCHGRGGPATQSLYRKVYHDVMGRLSNDNEANCCLNPQMFLRRLYLFSFIL